MDLIPPAWFWGAAAVITGMLMAVFKLTGLSKKADTAATKAESVERELRSTCETCSLPLSECQCPDDEVQRPPTARGRLEQVAAGIGSIRDEVRQGFRLQAEATGRVDGRLYNLEQEMEDVKGGQATILGELHGHEDRLALLELERRATKDGPDGNAARAILASRAMSKPPAERIG